MSRYSENIQGYITKVYSLGHLAIDATNANQIPETREPWIEARGRVQACGCCLSQLHTCHLLLARADVVQPSSSAIQRLLYQKCRLCPESAVEDLCRCWHSIPQHDLACQPACSAVAGSYCHLAMSGHFGRMSGDHWIVRSRSYPAVRTSYDKTCICHHVSSM
jgi:hypothetical protein